MEVPWTLMLTGARGDAAGPLTTEPLLMLKRLPWQGQLMVPLETLPTVHPACVHTAVNAWNVPDCGWVITIFLSARIVPPPTGTSEVLASTAAPPPPEPAPLPEAAGPELDSVDWASWGASTPPLLEL